MDSNNAALKLAAPATREWVSSASEADVALALDLGARCIAALGLTPPAVNSAAKGAHGEDEVFSLLSNQRRVRDVSRTAHCGDLVCESRAGPVYVEVKHYANTVPSSEVDKFLRDLRERDAAAGVFISLTSPIVGQRSSIAIVLEPRVSTGTLVPVVYAAPTRSSGDTKLHPSIALAAVDMAVCLAEVYPRGLRGLHGRDTIAAYAVAADQLAEGAASVRSELSRMAGSISSDVSSLGERLVLLGREARELARGQRAELEDVRESEGATSDALATEFQSRYSIRASPANLIATIQGIENSAGVLAGILGEGSQWRLLKARAIHTHTGCGFAFLKSATEVRAPHSRLPAERIAAIIKKFPKKVRIADGEFALELDDDTLVDVLTLVA